MSVLFFFVIALLSEVIGTVAGFGSSVFFVPLAGLFLDFHSVLMLTSILHVFSNAAKLILFGRHVRLRLLLLFGVPSVCLVILGAYLSARLQFKITELLLGLFLISFSLFLFLRPLTRLSPRPWNAISAGGLAGFLAGLIGTGGASAVSRWRRSIWKKETLSPPQRRLIPASISAGCLSTCKTVS